MPPRKLLAATGLGLTVVLGLSACGSSNDTSTASSSTTASTAASSTSSSTSMTEAEDDATSTTTEGGSGNDASSTTVDIAEAGGGSVTVVVEAEGKEQTLVMGFGTDDGDCTIDAGTDSAEVDVETEGQSFVFRYGPTGIAGARIEFTDTISSASENISLYADADTADSSIDFIQTEAGRATIKAQVSNTFAAYPATITVSCP